MEMGFLKTTQLTIIQKELEDAKNKIKNLEQEKKDISKNCDEKIDPRPSHQPSRWLGGILLKMENVRDFLDWVFFFKAFRSPTSWHKPDTQFILPRFSPPSIFDQ